MAQATVAVTGGNGFVGRAVLSDLAEHGYEIVNVSIGEREETVADRYLQADLTEPGDVYGALEASGADAIVHLGTIPSPEHHPGWTVFESNALSTYLVLEAASALAVDSIAVASSINVLGAAFQDEPTDVRYLPVDEAHPVTPRDPYAIGKHAMEVVAAGFGRRPGPPRTIASLRYPWVLDDDGFDEHFGDDGYDLDALAADGRMRDNLCSYLHREDAATAARAAIEAEFEGHEALWIAAADTTVDAPTAEVARRLYPGVEVRRAFEDREGLLAIDRAREVLEWSPGRSWTEGGR